MLSFTVGGAQFRVRGTVFTVGGACLQKEEHINGAVGLGGDFILSVSNDFCEKKRDLKLVMHCPFKRSSSELFNAQSLENTQKWKWETNKRKVSEKVNCKPCILYSPLFMF